MKDVLIVTNYCQFPGESGNNRYTYLADMLAAEGFEVEIVTSTFNHKTKSQRPFTGDDVKNVSYKTTLINEPGYPENVSFKRLYSHRIIALNIMNYVERRKLPDLIYCPFPPITIGKKMAEFAKRNRIPFVIDIQDLWPEAFRMVFNPPFLSNILYRPFERAANKIFGQVDAIVGVSRTYVDRAYSVNRKNVGRSSVFLGTDLNHFDSLVEKAELLSDEKSGIKVAYIGTLGSSYDINLITDAIALLKREGRTDIHFVVMGEGPKREAFAQYAQRSGISYEFTGMLPYEAMVKRLSQCDIAVNPIRKGAAQSIINKVGDYAAAGLPVVNTQENEEYRTYVDDLRIGFNCIPGESKDVAVKMEILCSDPDLRKEMGANNRKFAETNFDRRHTYPEIVRVIENLLPETVEAESRVL
ncbi:glycosyltransferase family 4 protein [Salimicrobium flavidum]|uniref:Glycosyltransferase involved in cell wall bisynthesis n=1 Tax=Salimicrobium flavidum TaxID=570947 RepID=A0A1N7KMW6_9BACI|nr:glycosyltransferase family 4 protein [Salimicrobium flavidum]SIS62935.1 Glycosyltransferase involved in cell wall bisynthesis [Salimicrobium flavidum]